MTERVLIVGAHPDDEVLGTGGVIARHASEGATVDILLVADGVTSRSGDVQGLPERRAAAQRAAKILGANAPTFLDFPDNRLDSVPLLDVVKAVERIVLKSSPDIIYTHHGADLNVDHRIVHQAVITALRPLPDASYRQLLAFEVCSSTEWSQRNQDSFQPDHFVDISMSLERKMAALDAYEEEMRDFPHARSSEAVRALATWRGATCGLRAAEAFSTIRSIVR